jgi:hypothetical protein
VTGSLAVAPQPFGLKEVRVHQEEGSDVMAVWALRGREQVFCRTWCVGT